MGWISPAASLPLRLCIGILFLAFPCSVSSMIPPSPSPPLPANTPAFSSLGSLSTPSEPLPSDPVLESDTGSIRTYSNDTEGAGSGSGGSGGQSNSAATASEWDGIKKLFQRALPFLAIGMALLCSCGLCCCCYCVYRRASRPAPPPYYGGPPPGFSFAASGRTPGPYPPCQTEAAPQYAHGYPPPWPHGSSHGSPMMASRYNDERESYGSTMMASRSRYKDDVERECRV